jgi:hypothetical protein
MQNPNVGKAGAAIRKAKPDRYSARRCRRVTPALIPPRGLRANSSSHSAMKAFEAPPQIPLTSILKNETLLLKAPDLWKRNSNKTIMDDNFFE